MFQTIEAPVWVFVSISGCFFVFVLTTLWFVFWFAYGRPQGMWVLSTRKIYRKVERYTGFSNVHFLGWVGALTVRDPGKPCSFADIRIYLLPEEPPGGDFRVVTERGKTTFRGTTETEMLWRIKAGCTGTTGQYYPDPDEEVSGLE
jgi:hypothetical protein